MHRWRAGITKDSQQRQWCRWHRTAQGSAITALRFVTNLKAAQQQWSSEVWLNTVVCSQHVMLLRWHDVGEGSLCYDLLPCTSSVSVTHHVQNSSKEMSPSLELSSCSMASFCSVSVRGGNVPSSTARCVNSVKSISPARMAIVNHETLMTSGQS